MPTVVGVLAMIILHGLYGVAVLFGGYAVELFILGRSGRGFYLAWASACLAAAILLVAMQSQL
ncbi:hypothetical protein [Frankia sp. AgKG'84/4]|uniref:hypothetical protein n=1 Tax=Frankia sp. AgKG'84/4 TaxID=573490 RepID=UPI00200E641E|nr:hypothetical protein [Frankia sp. AgKG'84/4]MCL9792785.1 hypothetical protein [Frankia sp. AgKG'84/4]